MTTDKRQHNMPFGAAPLPDGGVSFQLWAPAAAQVDVCLTHRHVDDSDKNIAARHVTLQMESGAEGCFSITTDLAATGTLYFFRIDGDQRIPDPASRFQPEDVHGPSEVIDPAGWSWQDTDWRGRPWEEVIIYELHVGSFTPQGNFAAVQEKLDYLAELGITAIELMPIADFPGKHNWGYDGTYLFAPDHRYGRPEDLKSLINAAHRRGLMVFLDVVYNHFGPEGNYLHLYAPQFFTEQHMTPWGPAINYDGKYRETVRQFYIHNALYWLEEYHFDGLRFDAVHAIKDDSQPDILTELAQRVHEYFGNSRHVHLVLENDHNAAHYLSRDKTAQPLWYSAQWNDDSHHALHVLLTSESDGYYMDYTDDPIHHLGRCLTEGFAYQGEPSRYRDDRPRGEASHHLPPTAFVCFLQNHDQVGNRAFGERMARLAEPAPIRAVLALLLLSPSPPLLFMGQEWGCVQPFAFFCDFSPELATQVAVGRQQEFARFPQFNNPQWRKRIPNPQDPATFEQSVLDWDACNLPLHRQWLALHRELLTLRRHEVIPRLYNIANQQKSYSRLSERALSVRWILGDGSELLLIANLGPQILTGLELSLHHVLYTTHTSELAGPDLHALPPWSVAWCMHTDTAT
ncbi:malto-oligosyltrehalose trehalohydrolase [Methylophaga sp. OBS4]|uniref:malto-oligosyltrehalose trehalohydrolase n=1 Tax=Methylophaga sp. OBS4 TaxID=2991935 RepID=UPI00224E3930|nr:malto-oligosyltrehalose trehalohydrolase [Methylophaga sp. OBS4]MCX4187690.1 malto-oligosyltrehalose trehalohydrolase [Methylophaga sp. OBS4]